MKEGQEGEVHNQNHSSYHNYSNISGKMDLFRDFVKLFNPDLLMVNPHLYTLFDSLVQELMGMIKLDLMLDYVTGLCTRMRRACHGSSNQSNSQSLTKEEIRNLGM